MVSVSEPQFPTASIRRYYDANTGLFLLRNPRGADGAIHRAIWGPGVASRAEAFRYVEQLIANRIAVQLEAVTAGHRAHVLDLGCGVGATLIRVCQALGVEGTGVTISAVQAALGTRAIADAGLASRVRCVEGDFGALPSDVPLVDAAWAIESFVHGPSPERFFSEAARVIRPGGLLMICDDVRGTLASERARRTVQQFEAGWHVNSLLEPATLRELAAHAGFVHESMADLTPYLELGRTRDRLVDLLADLLAALATRLPVASTRLAPLIGGSALQRGLRHGWITHVFAVWRRL